MKAVHLTDIFNAGQTIAMAMLDDPILKGMQLADFDRHQYLSNLLLFKEACSSLGLTSTLHQVGRVEAILREAIESNDGSKVLWDALKPAVVQMGIRYQEETENAVAYHLSADEQGLYVEPTKDWQDVLDEFPSALNDVDETGKCLAVGRYTASVFHAMRVLEFGLKALGNEFGVSTDRSNWGTIIRRLHDAIEEKSAELGASWSDQTFYSEAATQMTFFKDAWRNHVMHARVMFDQETAPPVIDYVRRFMKHLATKLSEANAG